MDNKSDDKLMRELGHETGGKTPRWMIPVVGVLLIGGAFAAAYYLSPDRAGEAAVPEKLRKSIEAKKNLTTDPKKLQDLMVGKDVVTAKLAVVRLAISGDKGWGLVIERLAEAEPEVQREVQTTIFAENMYYCAADAIESGPENVRAGALVVLDREVNFRTPAWALSYVFDSLAKVWPQEAGLREKFYPLMEQYHPVELDPFFEALKSESTGVRHAAVSAICAEPSVIAVATARLQGKNPDAKDVAAVKTAISRSLAAAKKPAATS